MRTSRSSWVRIVWCVGALLLLLPSVRAGEFVPPAMLEARVPIYPSAALRREHEGTVLVRVRVLASGQPTEVHVHKSSGAPELDQAAVEAARHSTFRAAQNAAGEPVDSWVNVPYRFVLQD